MAYDLGHDVVAAHVQHVSHPYQIAYPAHEPREGDPNYKDFHAYRKRTIDGAVCVQGARIKDFSNCAGELQLHHSHIEFALLNGINLKHLDAVYPGVGDPDTVGVWIETAANLEYRCEKHHIGAGHGVHSLTASDWEGSNFVEDTVFGAITDEDVHV